MSSTDISSIEERFAIFKAFYPIWKSNGKAKKAFHKLNVDAELLMLIMTALKNQVEEKRILHKIGAFVPNWKYPATWLNQECWEDKVILNEELLREQNHCKPRNHLGSFFTEANKSANPDEFHPLK